MSPGSMPVAREIYQEGLILPPVRLMQRGALVKDVMTLLLANVRTPDEREGDITAQIAANRVAEESAARDRRTLRASTKSLAYAKALQDYTARRHERHHSGDSRMASTSFEDALDDDGIRDRPVKIRAKITVKRDRATIDFSRIRSASRRQRERELRRYVVPRACTHFGVS